GRRRDMVLAADAPAGGHRRLAATVDLRTRGEQRRPAGARTGARSDAPVRLRPRPHAGRGTFTLLVLLLFVLNLVGLVMVLSASSVVSIHQYGSPWHYFERQVLWLLLGCIAFFVALRTDRRWWRRLARPAMVISVLLLFAVLVPHVGRSASGASRWLGTSSFQIQPSELAKLALILFAADVLDRRAARGERGDWRYQMGPVLAVTLLLAALVLAQPDMGTTVVIVLIALAMLCTAGMPGRPLAALLAFGAVGGGLMAVAAPYRWRRLTAFLHPFRNASNTGFQSVQGLLALGAGRLTGDGIGSSLASWGYLPNAPTDFIFAVIGEETGLVGTLLMSGLFLALAVVGVRIACGARDRFSGLMAAGVTAWLIGQAVINIGAVVGLLPVTGVPLPFVSFGGSSLVLTLFAAGLLGNIARQP
ncbi:MAG: putative lipid II flippase FtsW, partial [Actinomycetota bacterium]|nr:putative lipid II flippase FtsW [Actinomycetota bacterium]